MNIVFTPDIRGVLLNTNTIRANCPIALGGKLNKDLSDQANEPNLVAINNSMIDFTRDKLTMERKVEPDPDDTISNSRATEQRRTVLEKARENFSII